MNAEEYVRRGHRRVKGWLRPEAAALIAALARTADVPGNVAEIGVHHGKLFILLHLLRRQGDRSVALDLFELQDLNVDGSGKGDRAAFEKNLRELVGTTQGVVIRSADSTTIKSDEMIEAAGGKFRVFSVDGGHTAAITENDLRVAAESLVDGGLIILDDYFNVAWPGVSEGTNRFLSATPGIVPVGAAHGKMFFTNTPPFADRYRETMRQCGRQNSWHVQEQEFFGQPTVILRTRTVKENVTHAGKRLLTKVPVAPRLISKLRTET